MAQGKIQLEEMSNAEQVRQDRRNVPASHFAGFADKVYALCARIPRGKVATYKEIGNALGGRGQVYRAVGVALKKNPHAPIVPCHRVVASDGSIGGYHGRTTGRFIAKKIALLKKEGVLVKDGKIVDFGKKLFRF